MTETGTLFIVATPLGNLEDMTFRAVTTLKTVHIIAAEDTRHSKRLLNHYGISTRMISCHEHNEHQRASQVIDRLKAGKDVALITDAGTPCISDPGFRLVQSVSEQGLAVVPIPGCSAAIAGLSVSGLPTDSFLFKGFLPKKQGQRRRAIEGLSQEKATLIFYESPRRIVALIKELTQVLGDRPACLAREITKRHEEYIRGRLSIILERIQAKEILKGECSLFVHGIDSLQAPSSRELQELILNRLSAGPIQTSALAKELAQELNLSKKEIYNTILRLQNKA